MKLPEIKTIHLKDKYGNIIKIIKISEAEFFNKKDEGLLIIRELK